jgi:hypothetical protein
MDGQVSCVGVEAIANELAKAINAVAVKILRSFVVSPNPSLL